MEDNYMSLLYKHVKGGIFITTVIILLVIMIMLSLTISTYSTVNITGITLNGGIILRVPTEYSDTVKEGSLIKISDKKYMIEIISYGEIILDNNLISYQDITIKIEKKFKDNEIINSDIYYDKEKIIDKIKKIL